MELTSVTYRFALVLADGRRVSVKHLAGHAPGRESLAMDVIKSGLMVGPEQGKALKAIIKCASRDKTRPVLQAVHVTMHEYGVVELAATDSYRIARYRAKVGKDEARGRGVHGAVTIGVADAKRVAEYIAANKSRALPHTVYMGPDEIDGKWVLRVRSAYTDPIGLIVPTIDCNYPDFGRLVKRMDGKGGTTNINASYLADLVAIPTAIYGKGHAVRIDIADPVKPMTVRAEGAGSDYYGLLMPVRLPKRGAYCGADPAETLVPTVTVSAPNACGEVAA